MTADSPPTAPPTAADPAALRTAADPAAPRTAADPAIPLAEPDPAASLTAPERRARPGGPLARVVTGLIAVVTVVAIGLMLRGQDWSVLGTAVRLRHPGLFVLLAGLAVLANTLGLLATMLAWRATLTGVGAPIPVIAAARIFFAGQFAKYVPGRLLGLVLTVHMGRSAGVPAGQMASAWLLALLLSLLTGGTVAVLAGPAVIGDAALWLALAVLPTGVLLARPDLLATAARAAARLLRRPALEARVSVGAMRRAIVAQILAWVFGGVQLWLLALALGAPAARSLLLCVGVFSLGAVVGVLAVVVPDGIGVREAVLLTALAVVLPLPVATVVALASRLVVIVSELATSGIGLLLTGGLRRRSSDGTQTSPAGRTTSAVDSQLPQEA